MATQSFHCVLCQDNFSSIDDFNAHEKQELHRREFERRMDGTSIGLLLCKCCFISVPNLKAWDEHIKSKGHVKLVTQSEYLGKRCVWSVPGVKMKDGSIKLCKDLNQLFDCGWKDPDYVHKVTNQSLLESDLIIGMNCISLKSMVNDLPLYHCSLCCVDFHHNDRNHVIGRHHRINVVWNWEKKTADRIAKGLDFPKPSTKAKAQAELEEVTKKIFKMEQDCLDDDQFDLYQVMSTKKLPNDLGKTPVNRRPLMARPSTAEERPNSNDEPDQIINVRSRSHTPSEPPNKKPREAPEPLSKPQTKTQTKPQSKPQSKPLLSKPPTKPQTKPQTQPQPQINPQTQPQMNPRTQSQINPQTQPQVNPRTQPQMNPRTQPQMNPRTQPQMNPRTQTQTQIHPRTQSQVNPRTQPQINPRTQPQINPRSQPQINPRTQPQINPLSQSQINPRTQTQINPPETQPQDKSTTEDIQQHQAITLPPPMPLPQLSTTPDIPSSVDMASFSSPFAEVEEDDVSPEIRAEIELFDLMEELHLSGNFKPPESAKSADPTKLLNMLYSLGEGLLEYQTKKREIPMELPRDDIKEITNSISSIGDIIRGLSASSGETENKTIESEYSADVPVTS